MTNTTNRAPNLTFFGPGLDRVIEAHPKVVDAVTKLALNSPDKRFSVHVFPRFAFEPLEWSMTVTCAAGRATHEVSQRTPHGPVLLNSKILK